MIGYILVAIVSYVLGAIPFAQIVAGTRGIDLKKVGSGNIGTMNTLRATGSIPLTVLVLILDACKGAVSVLVSKYLSYYFGLEVQTAIILAAFFAVCGHNWSMFKGFKSGRGIATSLGIGLVVNWRLILVWVAIWLIGFIPTQIFSVGQVLAIVHTFGSIPSEV